MVNELIPNDNRGQNNPSEPDKPHSLIPYGKDESPESGNIRGAQDGRLNVTLKAFDNLIEETREKERRKRLAKESTVPASRPVEKVDLSSTPQKTTDAGKKAIAPQDMQESVRSVEDEITSASRDIRDDITTQLRDTAKRLATRPDKSITALEKPPQVFRDEGLLPDTVYVNNPKEGKTKKRKSGKHKNISARFMIYLLLLPPRWC